MTEKDAIAEFGDVVDEIYGVYLDITTSFWKLLPQMELERMATLQLIRQHNPEMTTQEIQELLDEAWVMYGTEDPNNPKGPPLHATTQRQYSERNSPWGSNSRFIGIMALVAIYQYWEDKYRSDIAELFGKEKDDLKEPVMGDLRLIRRSIIHHRGKALRDVESCELLKWFKEDEEIYIDYDKFATMVGHIKEMLSRYREELGR